MVIGAAFSFALIAGACSSKKNDSAQTVTSTTPAGTTTATPTTISSVATTTPGSVGATTALTTPATTATTAAPTTAAAEKPILGGKLIVSGEAKVASPWTPAAMQCDSYCSERARTFFDPIAALGDDGKVHPYLASKITPNADYSVWTITVRDGIKFTDGTPVNADALIRNLQDTGTGILVAGALTDVAKNPDKSLKIVKKDDMNFDIYMGKGGDPAKPFTWATFDRFLVGQWGLIASPTWLDAVKADPSKATSPIGSGPFTLASYTDDLLVVKKNPNYWLKDKNGIALPYLDEIDFKVIPDSANAEKALLAGDIDIFSTSNAGVVKNFRDKAAQYPMTEQTKQSETNYLLIDLSKPGPLSDQRVRCALSEAIDRKEVIDATEGGITKPANGPFSPGQQGYLDDNGLKTAQDLTAAKALIDDYKKTTGSSTVDVTIGFTPTADNATTAELLKGYWQQIGVNLTVQTVEQSAFITNALLGIPDFHMYGWRQGAGGAVDDQYFWWHSAGSHPDGQLSLNFARINDPKIDAGLDAARQATDPAAAQKAAEDVNREFGSQCLFIPIDYTIWGTPHKPSVQGLATTILPDGGTAQDGAGFSGQFWVNTIWIKP